MKSIAILIASAFAVSAFAAEPAKAPATPTATTGAPVVVTAKKDEKKPAKSEPAKKDAKAAPAAK